VVKGESSPFVMELPPYRMPSAKSVGRHTWEKGKQYLKKMGTTILVASIVVWALSYFPHHPELSEDEQMEISYIGQIGKFIEPVIRPCGLMWKEGVALIAGVGAKEIVASTMEVLYHGDISTSGMSTLTAFAFILFVLLYMPCIPACVGIKNESGQWKWAGFTALYTTLLAWLTSMTVYQIGSLF
jgi:ferrous iron transport protein B